MGSIILNLAILRLNRQKDGLSKSFLNIGSVFSNKRKVANKIKGLFDKLVCFLSKKLSSGIEIYNLDNSIKVKFDCPLEVKNEINLIFDKNALIIKKGSEDKWKIAPECYVPTERFNRWPYWIVQLQSEVDPKQARAVYKDGIYEITIPKKKSAGNCLN